MRHIDTESPEYLKWLREQTYYHGTSSNVKILGNILKPSIETGVIREQSLKYVYVTTSIKSAKKYAEKAAEEFGGWPVIYEVAPDFDSLVNRIDTEYTCDIAYIIDEI